MLWIGLISGTSADGVDAALARIGDEPRDVELLSYLEVTDEIGHPVNLSPGQVLSHFYPVQTPLYDRQVNRKWDLGTQDDNVVCLNSREYNNVGKH